MHDAQRHQVDINHDAFQRQLASIIVTHRDQYALMRDREIVGFSTGLDPLTMQAWRGSATGFSRSKR